MRSIQVGFGILYFVGNLFLVFILAFGLYSLDGEGTIWYEYPNSDLYNFMFSIFGIMIFLNLIIWGVIGVSFRKQLLINTCIIGIIFLTFPSSYSDSRWYSEPGNYTPFPSFFRLFFQSFIILSLLQYLFLSRRARNKIQRHTSLIQGEVGDPN